jgi:hypothetical protein
VFRIEGKLPNRIDDEIPQVAREGEKKISRDSKASVESAGAGALWEGPQRNRRGMRRVSSLRTTIIPVSKGQAAG